MNEETVYGIHAVRALLERRPQAVRRVLVQSGREDRRAHELANLARERGVKLESRPPAELDALAGGGVHQGVVAKVVPAAPLAEEDLLMRLGAGPRPPLLLVLDGVQDPHNLGACLRTADAAGADAVVVPRDRATGLTPVVRKVAAGAAETIAFSQVTNLARFLRALKEQGLWVIGTEGEAETLYTAADLKGPLAVVLGAEGAGMRRLTREHCDLVVRLPMLGAVESLNVSVATGIVLYEALRQRAAST
ncbi:MAG: 23S rRNA (guanosine(2251)-2'-O)-methyltransferase RlmB [Proteobacteria bacterium]|nr:23S rRNA (guanosine(2251)-2'-O)-methyltransferase RlmB [Pseudomonadota bacterium]